MSANSVIGHLVSGSDRFLLRWRGRQEGPYNPQTLDAKLAANEIGMLHEIFHDGRWTTIRDFVGEREAIYQARLRAEAEERRRLAEEAERKAKASQDRAAQMLGTNPMHIDASNATSLIPPPSPQDRPSSSSSGLNKLGGLLLMGGLAVGVYFLMFFDISVETGLGGRVNNFGLMSDRQNGMIAGIGAAVVGAVLIAVGSQRKKN